MAKQTISMASATSTIMGSVYRRLRRLLRFLLPELAIRAAEDLDLPFRRSAWYFLQFLT